MEELSLNTFLQAFLLTLFAGLSTSVGAMLAFFSKDKNYTVLSVGMGFSAGVMIYVSFVEILSKSKYSFTQLYSNEILGESLAIASFFGGIGFSALIDYLIPEDVNPHEIKSDKELSELKPKKTPMILKAPPSKEQVSSPRWRSLSITSPKVLPRLSRRWMTSRSA
jgi:ZIP family zinc transporter